MNKGICFSCENARQPWAESLLTDGYCGCCALMIADDDAEAEGIYKSIIGEVVGLGWIRPSSGIDSKYHSGGAVNNQIVTKNVTFCPDRKSKGIAR